ncbi:MAG: polysaccharide deacetylase family protein [Rhodospirillales bacterium]
MESFGQGSLDRMSKRVVKWAITASGLDRCARALFGGVGAVLMFHRVTPRGPSRGWSATQGLKVAPAALDSFIDTLRGEGYELDTASEAARRLGDGGRGGRFAALTFDDGYRDNHDVLLPLLRRRGVRATVYVSAGFIDRGAPMWWFGAERALAQNDRVRIRAGGTAREFPAATPEEKTASHARIGELFLGFTPEQTRRAVLGLKQDHGVDCLAIADELSMDWEQVRALDRSGLVEIGGHAVSHCPLAAMSDAEAEAEIAGGRRRLAEKLGRAPQSFAYPYGIQSTVGPRDIALARAAGYASAFTTQPRPLMAADAAHPLALPRIALGGNDDSLALRLRLSGIRADRLPYAA